MTDNTCFLTLTSDAGPLVRRGEPIVIGVPLPRKSIYEANNFALADSKDNPVPCEAAVLDRWPDNSARWVLLAFRAEIAGGQAAYKFKAAAGQDKISGSPDSPALAVKQEGEKYTIDTGPVQFELAPGIGWPVRNIHSIKNGAFGDSTSSGLCLMADDGSSPISMVRTISIESAGSIRAVACCRGESLLASGKKIEIDWRLEFFLGLPIVIVHLTMRNPHKAIHPGGYWELGDRGSLFIREAVFRLNSQKHSEGAKFGISPEPDKPFNTAPSPFNIYQDSSGGENWQSRNQVNRENRVPVSFRGYRITGSIQAEGLRATPIVAFENKEGRLALAARHFWQNFPKSLDVSQSGITYGVFPSQYNDLHELQGGEQKTHVFALSFGDDGITETPLEWFRQPLIPAFNPDWIAKTEAVPYFSTGSDFPPQYLEMSNAAIEGNDTFEQKREAIDEYGWRHFGDLYGDHEAIYAVGFKGPGPLVSHYNNQYDLIAGFCSHWLRSGDSRWWSQFNELAAHVVDIDIYHTQEDKAAYNNGLFWHTFHYIEAGLATHRSYPRIGKSNGGGPANEHVYNSGLRLHYLFTGDMASREAAIGLAQFIIDIDDGNKTVFRWLSRGNTGLASQSASPFYHGPGRGSGNATAALIDGYLLTRDRRFIEKAEQIIMRVVHPRQNIESLNLKDVERKWFYTMFLQALGRYLDLKVEIGELDNRYAYARQCLLHFARWMADNECLYLDRPEVLEYPTETWPAQDLRKGAVFDLACKYSNREEKLRFRERAEYFYGQALESLAKHKTWTLARPMVLLLTQGFAHAWFRNNSDASAPEISLPEEEIGLPRPFIPQKTQAIRNAKRLALACGIIGICAIAAAIWLYLFR